MVWFGRRGERENTLSGLGAAEPEARRLVAHLDSKPGDLRARRQLGDLFKKAGRVEDAVQQYQALVGAYAAQGLLFRAIAACKLILELLPDHEETTATLAQLYARRTVERPPGAQLAELPTASADDVKDVTALSPEMGAALTSAEGDAAESIPDASDDAALAPPPMPADAADDAVLSDEGDVIDASALAGSMMMLPEGAVQLERPPAVPLFSGLSASSFRSVVKRLSAWEAEPNAVIVAEGEESDSVFVVVRGRVRVERAGAALATLGADSFFGEMALLSKRPRAASVIAESKTELLEIPRAVLDELVKDDAGVAGALEQFCRARLLDNLARSSPVFRGLPDDVVKAALAGFDTRRAVAGDVLIEEGKSAPALFVVLQGDADVVAKAEIGTIRVKQLGAGDVFGEMSLLDGGPATATVTASSPSLLLMLPRAAWDGFVKAHAPLAQRLEELAQERRAFNERFLPDATSSAVLV